MFPARDAFSQSIEEGNSSQEQQKEPWPETTSSHTAPRWKLQTDQEETDSRSQIEKLERKLKMAKQRQYGTISKQSDHSGSDSEDQAQFETDEGLPLLWSQRHEDLDHALQQRKNQDIYTHKWYHYLSCCCCPTDAS